MQKKGEMQKKPEEDAQIQHSPGADNLSGILVVVLSIMLLSLFIFGLSRDEYRLIAVSIPVGIFTVAFLALVAVLAWEYSKKQF